MKYCFLLISLSVLSFSSCFFEQDVVCSAFNQELFDFLPYKEGESIRFKSMESDSVITLRVSQFAGEHVVAINNSGDGCYEYCNEELSLSFDLVGTDTYWALKFEPLSVGSNDTSHWNVNWQTHSADGSQIWRNYSESIMGEPSLASLVDSLGLPFSDVYAFSNYETLYDQEEEKYYIEYNPEGFLFERNIGLVLIKPEVGETWVIDDPVDSKEFLISNVQYNEYEKYCE